MRKTLQEVFTEHNHDIDELRKFMLEHSRVASNHEVNERIVTHVRGRIIVKAYSEPDKRNAELRGVYIDDMCRCSNEFELAMMALRRSKQRMKEIEAEIETLRQRLRLYGNVERALVNAGDS